MLAKSKWDSENLHRHTEYAPVKKEPVLQMGNTSNPSNNSLRKRPRILIEICRLTCPTSYAQRDG